MRSSSLRAPGLIEIFIGSILAVLLGAVVAAVILVLKPVAVLTEAPKDKALDPARLYYFQGRKEYTAGQRWRFKRDALVQGHSVSVNEDELNTWIEEIYPKLPIETQKPAGAKTKPGAKSEKDASAQPFIQTGTPNFRLTSDTLRLGVVYYVNLFGFGSFQVVAQSDGTFEKPKNDDKPIVYKPATFYLGSLPVHKLLVLKAPLFKQVVGTFELPAEMTAVWARLADVRIEGRELVLAMPAAPAATN